MEWAGALRAMASKGEGGCDAPLCLCLNVRRQLSCVVVMSAVPLADAVLLLPGHGPPIIGADRVRQALNETGKCDFPAFFVP